MALIFQKLKDVATSLYCATPLKMAVLLHKTALSFGTRLYIPLSFTDVTPKPTILFPRLCMCFHPSGKPVVCSKVSRISKNIIGAPIGTV